MCSGLETSIHIVNVWHALVAWWGVPVEDGLCLWDAVQHSTALRPTVLRENLSLVGDQHTLTRFVEQACSPSTVLRTIDDLADEGAISGALVARLYQCVQRRVDPSGQWRR